MKLKTLCLAVIILVSFNYLLPAREFTHPGIDMSKADLEYMRKMVREGKEPWKSAFDRMQSRIKTDVPVIPFAHVQRGPYGKPNIGGGELSRNSEEAYDCALLWFITGDTKYSNRAMEILKAWSQTLQDFDYNDAKLLAGWTGYLLCNAAEILKYEGTGWKKEDIDSFTKMLLTVYYPLLRYYYPQANGNWDGAIIHSILAIAIFTDNSEMFDNAIDHFLRGPVNGSLFKYIWPSGQCQETTRDQGHVQLGLGEFAGAARVAYTQGVDLFSSGNCRIATGYEYTAGFILGGQPHSYGIISDRAKNIRDDYEYVYRHYLAKGIMLPNTRRCADSVRKKATRSVLTAFRDPVSYGKKPYEIKPEPVSLISGSTGKVTYKSPQGAIIVKPGESIQEALDKAAGKGQWVIAGKGIHKVSATIKIPSSVTLAGEGIGTILFLDPETGLRDLIVKGEKDLHDVTIRDLVIEGNTRTDVPSDPNTARSYRSTANRGGIMLISDAGEQIKNISLLNVTVKNCTYNAVFLNGVNKITIEGCDFNESGSSVVPGPKLQHNLLISYSSDIKISGSRLVNSPFGSGLMLNNCTQALIEKNEISRNGYYGITLAECNNITIRENLIEANDRSGIVAEYLFNGCNKVTIEKNKIQYNNGFAVETWAASVLSENDNEMTGNGKSENQTAVIQEKRIIMY